MEEHNGNNLQVTVVRRTILFTLLLLFTLSRAEAYSLRQFTSKNGLSNSAILSICQDRNGIVWIGSCDGLNMYDGVNLGLYKPTNIENSLSGNLIENIIEGEEDVLWIQTNYGLDRFDTRRQTIQTFHEFKDISRMAKSPEGDLFIIKDDGYIYYYPVGGKEFGRLNAEKTHFEDVRQIVVDGDGILWIFSSGSDNRSYMIEHHGDKTTLIPCNYFDHPEKLLSAFTEGDVLYFIDRDRKSVV